MTGTTKTLLILLLLAIGLGCDQPTAPVEGDHDPTASDDGDSPGDDPIPKGSALPAAVPEDGDSYCPGAPESEWRGHEPSLAAWVDVADAIFVGTVVDVSHVESPVYLQEVKDNGEQVFSKLADVGECPDGGRIQWAMRIDFEDVDTLHGDDVGEALTIQTGRSKFLYPGVRFPGEADYPVDLEGNRVYHPGARVGAALFSDVDGNPHWRYRQFEVISDTVYLQEIDEDAVAVCHVEPLVTSIPDQYDGVPFGDFAHAVQNASRPLTNEEKDAIAARHENWARRLATGESKMLSQTICHPPFEPTPEPDGGDRDPDASP